MVDVVMVDKTRTKPPAKQRGNFTFKVISLGSFYQDLPDNLTILNRPQIAVDEKRKKWGNEYILYNNMESPENKCYVGSFGLDKKKRLNIHLYKLIDIPINKPDYYILTITHDGKMDKSFDLIKADPSSFSKIFSSAYHLYENENRYSCETTLVLQHGDKVTIDGKEYVFSGKSEELE